MWFRKGFHFLLTAGRVALLEDCCYLRVHLDLVILFALELVPLVHPRLHPLLEWLSNQCVDDIAYVGPREFQHLSGQWAAPGPPVGAGPQTAAGSRSSAPRTSEW